MIEQLLYPPTQLHSITSYTVWCMLGVFVLAVLCRFFRLASQFTLQASALLTSIGILGTFLGIVIGLQGVDLSNTATEESVRTLLGGMTLAFTSSLVGMALSIVYKVLMTIPPFAHKIADVDDSNRQVLALLQNTAAATEKQNQVLDSIAIALGTGDFSSTTQLLGSMNDMLDQRLRTLVDTTVSQQRQIAQLNEAVGRLVQAMVEDDAQSLTGQMRGLRNELSDRHRQQGASMTEMVESLRQQSNHQNLHTEAINKVAEAQSSLVSLQQNTIDAVNTGLSELGSTIKLELNNGVGKVIESIEAPLASLNSQGEKHSDIAQSLLDQINKQHDDQRTFWQQADQHLVSITTLLERSPTEEIIDALKTTIREFNEHISEQFGENFAQLNTAVGKLLEWQENYRQQLGDMREQFDLSVSAIEQVSEVVKTVGGSVEEIHRHTEKIPEHMSRLGDVVQTNQTQVDVLESHLSAFAETRNRAVEALPKISEVVQDTVQGMASASDSLSKAVNEGATELKGATGSLTEAINTGTQDLQSAFVRSLEGYVKATEAVNDTAEGITQRTQAEVVRLYDHLQETVKQAHQDSSAGNQELIRTQFENMGRIRQEETEAVIKEMANALAQITGRFTQDYSKLVNAMGEIVQQAANDASR